jgi:hypothetical protein
MKHENQNIQKKNCKKLFININYRSLRYMDIKLFNCVKSYYIIILNIENLILVILSNKFIYKKKIK